MSSVSLSGGRTLLVVFLIVSLLANAVLIVMYLDLQGMYQEALKRIEEEKTPEHYVNQTTIYHLAYDYTREIYYVGMEFPIEKEGIVIGDGKPGPHYNDTNTTAWKEIGIYFEYGYTLHISIYWNDTSVQLNLFFYEPGKAPSQDGTGEDYYRELSPATIPGDGFYTWLNSTGEWVIAVDVKNPTNKSVEFRVVVELTRATYDKGYGFFSAHMYAYAISYVENYLFKCKGIDRFISVISFTVNFTFISRTSDLDNLTIFVMPIINGTETMFYGKTVKVIENAYVSTLIPINITFRQIFTMLNIRINQTVKLDISLLIRIPNYIRLTLFDTVMLEGERVS